jgi:FtsZ-binding cell division protein ZapB
VIRQENIGNIGYDTIKQLQKENAELKAKCNLCYDDKAEKSNNALIELNNKLVARNGRILDLENELTEYELINKHHIELIGRLEEQLKAIPSRDKIIEVLTDYYYNERGTLSILNIETIADEILGDI